METRRQASSDEDCTGSTARSRAAQPTKLTLNLEMELERLNMKITSITQKYKSRFFVIFLVIIFNISLIDSAYSNDVIYVDPWQLHTD